MIFDAVSTHKSGILSLQTFKEKISGKREEHFEIFLIIGIVREIRVCLSLKGLAINRDIIVRHIDSYC